MAKRCAEAAREGKDKPFGGAAADAEHNQIRQRAGTYSSVPAPLFNQILELIEGYLYSIDAAATQAVANGGPLAELSTSLSISVNTVALQAK